MRSIEGVIFEVPVPKVLSGVRRTRPSCPADPLLQEVSLTDIPPQRCSLQVSSPPIRPLETHCETDNL